jgi:hypothetical protein
MLLRATRQEPKEAGPLAAPAREAVLQSEAASHSTSTRKENMQVDAPDAPGQLVKTRLTSDQC